MADPKEFQRKTIVFAFNRLKKKNARFLVADEVGLGKTIIARMVIEEVFKTQSFKGLVFYVCSSLDLATQNLKKLRLNSEGKRKYSATRLTTLPLEEFELKNKTKIVAITPGTSLDTGRNLGKKDERFFVHSIFNHIVGRISLRSGRAHV